MERLVMDSPIGAIEIVGFEQGITSITFLHNAYNEMYEQSSHKTLLKTKKQLEEYFEGKRTHFTIPLVMTGTTFQKRVWEVLKSIPFGEVRTYKDIAVLIGNVNSSRAVGGANNKNHLPIVIPCHRVIGSNGSLTGYAGGTDVKEWLLEHERSNKSSINKE